MKKTEKYEFMGIIKPFLPEDVRIKLLDKIKGTVAQNGGKITKEDIWGKRHLAYPIKGHEEGYYFVFNVELPSKGLALVNREYRLIGDLLRYILLKEE